MSRRSTPSEQYNIYIEDVAIPVHVFYEYRRNARVASGKKCVYLRVPRYCTTSQRESFKEWCSDWIKKQWAGNPRFRTTFTNFNVFDCLGFTTYDTTFRVSLNFEERRTCKGVLEGNTVNIVMPPDWSSEDVNDNAYKIIHRLLSKHYSDPFADRVQELHSGNFSKPVDSISLKNLSSKWGSCSHTGKMSFSTRLLFAPKEVQDYVIIHELCHLDELNHSKRFWNLVESFDSEYKQKEQWLKEKGHLCDLHFGRR